MSKFLICITRVDQDPVFLYPGAKGERDLKADIGSRLLAKGVGIGKTQAHVLADFFTAFDEAMADIKSEVVPT